MSRSIPQRIIDSSKSNELRVTLRVGKDGLSQAVIMELKDQLKSRELVKLKINKGVISERRDENPSYLNLRPLLGQSLFSQEET